MEVFFLDILYEFHEIWNQGKCNEICIKPWSQETDSLETQSNWPFYAFVLRTKLY